MCLAVPGKIVSVSGEDLARQARVDFGGVLKEVNLAYVPEAQIGEYVLVHVGFAISVVDEEEAGKVFGYLKEMGELGELGDLTPRSRSKAVKFQSEYRDAGAAQGYAQEIRRITTRPWTIMEICGGQTHAIVKFGLDELLPERDRAGARAGLPGVRHAAGADRQGGADCATARGDLLLLRRHAARAGKRRRSVRHQGARTAMCASCIRRWTR